MSDNRTRSMLWSARPVQALIEAGLLGLLLLAGVFSLHTELGPLMTEQGAFSVAALTALGLGLLWTVGWAAGARWLGWDTALERSTFGRAGLSVLVNRVCQMQTDCVIRSATRREVAVVIPHWPRLKTIRTGLAFWTACTLCARRTAPRLAGGERPVPQPQLKVTA